MPTELLETIRPIQKADISAVHALFSAGGQYVTARHLSDYWLYATLFSETCLVAVAEQEVIGAVISFTNQENPSECYCQDLLVAAPFRQQGVGLALMQALMTRTMQRGIQRLWLTSEPENLAALKLWQQLGFTNPEADHKQHGFWVTRDLKGPDRDRVIFERMLR